MSYKSYKTNLTYFFTAFVCLVFILSSFPVQAATIQKQPNNLGLAGYWPLDEGVGTIAGDASGRGDSGSITAGAWTAGKHGKALSFDGSSSYVNVPDAPALNPTNITMSAWVKTSTAGKYIIAKDPANSETLRPNGAGDETALGYQSPPSGSHWDKVAEVTADGFSTYVQSAGATGWTRDLYALSDHTGSGSINSATVHSVCEGDNGLYAKNSIRTNGTTYDASPFNVAGWKDASSTWATNPYTGLAWTWSDIDALQAGVNLYHQAGGYSILKGQPILMADGSQKNIEDVSVGDEIISFNTDSRKTESDKITQVMRGNHDDYIVFNGTLKTSTNHFIWANGEFKEAKDIKIGDFLLNSEGQGIAVTQIQYIPEKVDTYDLSVEKNHNFFASNYLVHNLIGVTCTQVYVVVNYNTDKTTVPYALSTVNGGEFLLMNGGTSYTADSSVSVNDGKWHHLAATYDGTTMRIYVDGVQTGSSTSFSGNLPALAGALHIGADYNASPGNFFNGAIDDVRIYSRALSAPEISNMYGAGQITSKQVSNGGLIGYWPLNEGRGTQAGDSSGKNNSGSLTGTTWVTGKRGGALSFDGSGHASSANITQYSTTALTVSFWEKAGPQTGKEFLSDYGHGQNMFETWIASPSSYSFYIYGPGAIYRTASVYPLDNTWHLVTNVYNGATLELHVYIDGVLRDGALTGTVPATMNVAASPLDFGSYYSGGSYLGIYTGLLDDVRVYNRALSAAEVTALYGQNETTINHSQNTRATSGLLGLWSFNGPDLNSTTAFDRSGSGFDATLGGTAFPKPTIGKVGQALSFNGSSSYVITPSLGAPPTNITLSAWIKPNASGGVVLAEIGQALINNGWHDSHMEVETDNSIKVCMWTGGETCVTAATGITYGQWYHVVMRYNSVGTTLSSFVNGVAGGSTNATKQYPGTLYYDIGGADSTSGGNGAYFSGLIDEVRIYSRALSNAEITQLYLMGK